MEITMKNHTIKRSALVSAIAGALLSVSVASVHAAPDDALVQELAQKIEELGREVNVLRGDNEKLTHELEQLKSNQKKGFLAIDERFEKNTTTKPVVAKPATAKPVAATAVKAPVKPVATPVVATGKPTVAKNVTPKPVTPQKQVQKKSTNVEKAEYNRAYQVLKGNRQQGINAFTAFLGKYPNSPLAENAHYWIGEAKYAKKDYKGAIDSFVVVLNKYKSGRKAPDAAVKLGYSFYALKDWALARRTFNDVLRYFPGSNASKLAQARLDRMQKEGHL
ncbi:MAG TPA: tol-pal system protein YbgF [Thiothrix sp.]|nr:tol-pal system protein YbgF [Thiothrix sp.]